MTVGTCMYETLNGDVLCPRKAEWRLHRGWGPWNAADVCEVHIDALRDTLRATTSWVERVGEPRLKPSYTLTVITKSAPAATLTRKSVTAEIKAIDEAKGLVTAYVNTMGVVDADEDIIAPGAFQKSLSRGKKPVICWMHDWSDVIGQVTSATEEAVKGQTGVARLLATMQFDMDDPEAVTYFGKVRKGYVTEWSVGFYATAISFEERDGRMYRLITDLDWAEVSPVLRGASPNTTTVSAKERSESELEDVDILKAQLAEARAELATLKNTPLLPKRCQAEGNCMGTATHQSAASGKHLCDVHRNPTPTAPATSIPDAAGTDSAEALLDEYRKQLSEAGVPLSTPRAKAGRRNSSSDAKRIQTMHDMACELGAECATQE